MYSSTNPSAAVLIIGNEILSGRTQDANLFFLAGRLAQAGIILAEARVVADSESAIITALNALRATYTYVFTTGGIGPTHDDITMEMVAKAFGVAVTEHPEAARRLLAYYGLENFNTPRRRMALLPKGADLIDNPISAAPGAVMGNVYVLPGVPSIMQAMFDGLLPKLAGGAPVVARSIACAAPESLLAEPLRQIAETYPDLSVGSYPTIKSGQYALALVVRGTDLAQVEAAAAAILALAKTLDAGALIQVKA